MRQSIVRVTNINPLATLLLAAATLVAVFLSLMVGPTAHASATGCAGGNPQYGPSYYCATINGGGTYVNYVSGFFRGSAFVCDYRITAEFFDNNWRWYQTYNSATAWGCGNGGDRFIGIYSNKRPGYMCSTLIYRGASSNSYPWRTMSVCHKVA